MGCWEQLCSCLVILADSTHYLLSVRESCEGTSCSHDVFHRGQILALGHGASAAWAVYVSYLTCMTVHCLHYRFLRQHFNQLEFLFCFRNCHVACQSCVRIKARLLCLCAEFLFPYGFDNLHAVNVYPQIPFNGSLGKWLRRCHYSCHVVRFLAHRVHVCGSSAYVDYHYLTKTVVKQLGALHYCSRCRDDRSVYHVPYMFHSRCICDVILECRLDYSSARFNVHVINPRIYVLYVVQLLSAFFVKNQFHFFLIFDVACVDYWSLKSQSSYLFCVVQGCVSFAVVHSSSYEDEVRLYFFYLLQVCAAKLSCGYIVDDSSCTQGGFFGGSGCHVVNQSVHRHLQSSRCGGCCQHLIVFQAVDSLLPAKVVDCSLEPDSYVPFHYACGRLSLSPKFRVVAIYIFKCIHYCCS